MVRSILCVLGIAATFSYGWVANAEDIGPSIDLTSFDQEAFDNAAEADDLPLHEVAQRMARSPRRIYLSGMIGPSFANVSSPIDTTLSSDDTLFNAGGALGIAFERPRGLLRLELEGMGRDTYHAPFNNTPTAANYTVLTNNWSVMQNVWRDVQLTERFGIYGGGGIGAGGYILGEQLDTEVRYADPGSSFAWQFGGGLLWNISDRLTFDVGYRYFAIDTIQQASYVWPNRFEASELMFSLRLFEPFRSWRR
jgi:opacity protein-like surface antigen